MHVNIQLEVVNIGVRKVENRLRPVLEGDLVHLSTLFVVSTAAILALKVLFLVVVVCIAEIGMRASR
jgi:hypothetical protein